MPYFCTGKSRRILPDKQQSPGICFRGRTGAAHHARSAAHGIGALDRAADHACQYAQALYAPDG